MVFSSLQFLYLFLPVSLIAYFMAPRRIKNLILALFSLAFYYFGEQGLALLLILSTVVDFFCSLGIEKYRTKPNIARLLLIASIVFNLAMLGFFKYTDLVIRSINLIFDSELRLLELALPIGISFFTFQTMSYTIDVYRGNIKAERDFIAFMTFVTLFPQLIAGPIVRYSDIAAELKNRRHGFDSFGRGVSRFCTGLAKKALLANTLAQICQLYDAMTQKTALFTWIYAISFTLQIYFDFSGYSDMAIGIGSMLGFTFPENFNFPYIAKSIKAFWRRWHMTLGGWFRDYVYIPLGGNRAKPLRVLLNIGIVWFLTGLWHGAEYTFAVWGLYYGFWLLLERLILGRLLDKCRGALSILPHIYTLLITVFGFVLFNAESVGAAVSTWGNMLGINVSAWDDVTLYYGKRYIVTILLSVILATPLLKSATALLKRLRLGAILLRFAEPVFCILLLLVSTASLVDGSYNPFLYFRF